MLKLIKTKYISILFLCLLSACNGGPSYPYYSADDLNSICKNDAEYFSNSPEVDSSKLKRIFIIPTRFRKFVAGFVDEFTAGLESKGWVVMDSDTQVKSENILTDIKEATGIDSPDIVAFYMIDFEKSTHVLEQWKELPNQKFTKIFINEDLNNEINIYTAREFSKWGDAVFARYPEAFTRTISPNQSLCFPLYHGASHFYFDAARFDNEKEPNALLSGALDPSYYPLRSATKNLLDFAPELIAVRSHPGYGTPGHGSLIDPKQEAKNYAADLAKHKIAITGAVMGNSTPAPSLVAKHFEIAATGGVLITDKFVAPLMLKLGFVENAHYITSTPDTLESTLREWLAPDKSESLKEISKATHALVQSRHTLEHRVEQFDKSSAQLHEKLRGKLK